jgi:hypothetical protein
MRKTCVSKSRTIGSSSTTSIVLSGSEILAAGSNPEIVSDWIGTIRRRFDGEDLIRL